MSDGSNIEEEVEAFNRRMVQVQGCALEMLESDMTPENFEVDESCEFRFTDIWCAETGYRDIVSFWEEGGYGPVEVERTIDKPPLIHPDMMIEFGRPGEEMISNYRKLIQLHDCCMDNLPDLKRIDIHCPKCGIVIPKFSIYCPECLKASREENMSKPEGSRLTEQQLMNREVFSIYKEVRRLRLEPSRYSEDFPIYDMFPD